MGQVELLIDPIHQFRKKYQKIRLGTLAPSNQEKKQFNNKSNQVPYNNNRYNKFKILISRGHWSSSNNKGK